LAKDELDKIASDKRFVNRSDLLRHMIVEFLDHNGVDKSIINEIEREHRKTVENREVGNNDG
jgi:metal-responsive CopG/Arc/MetJ family transcriptional regulator